MIDERFYLLQSSLPALKELATAGGADIYRECKSATSVNIADESNEGDLVFIESDKGMDWSNVKASVCIVPENLADKAPKEASVLTSPHPRWSFAKAAELIADVRRNFSTDAISETVLLEQGVKIGHHVVIGENAHIGSGTIIGHGTIIGPSVTIGRDCVIGSNVNIQCSYIGNSVKIQSSAVLGESGFGLSIGPEGAIDTPHFGRVIIQDNVSIGAGSCVDRGLFKDTIIGDNAKIDNMCHIAHNVEIGAHAVLAAFVGIAGSSIIGKGVQIGGAAVMKDHIKIGDFAKVSGGAAVMSDIPPNVTWAGYPAKPIKTFFRENVWVSKQVQNHKK